MITSNQAEKLFLIGRPFSFIYACLMSLRRRLYGRGILKARKLSCPVISIGNLSLGGTGKTPHVVSICSFLKNRGYRPCILTRGYGGKAGRGPVVVSDGKDIMASAKMAGDEPWMMASQLEGVPVVAGSDRYRCGQYAIKHFRPSVFVLDDGFQHIRLYRDIDLVLMEAPNPFGSGHVFPGGTLRESPKALSLADAVILTKCNEMPFNMLELVEEEIRPFMEGQPIFRSFYQLASIEIVCGEKLKKLDSNNLSNYHFFCFCGLARPDSLTKLLTNSGVKVTGSIWFPDHHFYSQKDLKRIGEMARLKGCSIVLTTEKDFAKILVDQWDKINRKISLAVVNIDVGLPQSFWHFLTCRLEGSGPI